MNDPSVKNQDSYRELMLMSELEGGAPISQREIAGRLGIALGLVNSYLKNLVQKGFVTVKDYPRNRYAYLLTPKGFSEKSRLAFEHLSNFTRLYKVARKGFETLFLEISEQGYRHVAFCGVDETAEIAFLSLQESQLSLSAVLDVDLAGHMFFGQPVLFLNNIQQHYKDGPVIVTSYYRTNELLEILMECGVSADRIYNIEVRK